MVMIILVINSPEEWVIMKQLVGIKVIVFFPIYNMVWITLHCTTEKLKHSLPLLYAYVC